jgi:hypothetical protein
VDLSYALITPSFRLDFERCALLVESAERWVPRQVRHYLVVDKRDVPLFRSLAGPRTEVLVVEEIVPPWIVRLPGVRRFWWSWRSRPIKNWILQQMVKLSVATTVPQDVLLYVDSDVFFAAPFEPKSMERDGRVPLFVEEGQIGKIHFNDAWHSVAAHLLGLPVEAPYDTNFIGNVICWRRENALTLQQHLTKIARRPWPLALAPQSVFSEYILYGLYMRRVLGERSGHYADNVDRTLTYWDEKPMSSTDLAGLLGKLQPFHHSVMVSAKSKTPVPEIRKAFASHLK